NLIEKVDEGGRAVNVLLSREETYADISPVRLNSNGISAFISIMRGCDNMCSFCVVPFTRGRERSRDVVSIVKEAQDLFNAGYKEVTLLGQNVDSYKYTPAVAEGEEAKPTVNFAQLLELVAQVSPELRIRFSTSHPKDITDEVLYTMAKYENICNYIHLPVQSGNSRVLELMNRTYDREWYINRVDAIRRIIPECGISTDVITGFCTETEEEHQETLSMMKYVKYDEVHRKNIYMMIYVKYEYAYMFSYSERPSTFEKKYYDDDISEEVKRRRMTEIVDILKKHSLYKIEKFVGKVHRELIEGTTI